MLVTAVFKHTLKAGKNPSTQRYIYVLEPGWFQCPLDRKEQMFYNEN
jgi:hypothetical protein